MIAEDVEFQISQYVDGTLSAAEMKYVDDLVRSNPEAQKVLADYRRLNGHLTKLRTGPAVRWDQFAQQISNEIEQSDRPAVAGRIGFALSHWRIAAALLVAGSALIVAKIALRSSPVVIPVVPSISDVIGPQAEVAKGPGPAVQDVSIGPSPVLARGDSRSRYGEGVISHGPPKILLGEIPKAPTNSH